MSDDNAKLGADLEVMDAIKKTALDKKYKLIQSMGDEALDLVRDVIAESRLHYGSPWGYSEACDIVEAHYQDFVDELTNDVITIISADEFPDVVEWMFPNMTRRSANIDVDDEYTEILLGIYNYESGKVPESEFCECEKPDIMNLSIFRAMWVCKKCNKDIKDAT